MQLSVRFDLESCMSMGRRSHERRAEPQNPEHSPEHPKDKPKVPQEERPQAPA